MGALMWYTYTYLYRTSFFVYMYYYYKNGCWLYSIERRDIDIYAVCIIDEYNKNDKG